MTSTQKHEQKPNRKSNEDAYLGEKQKSKIKSNEDEYLRNNEQKIEE